MFHRSFCEFEAELALAKKEEKEKEVVAQRFKEYMDQSLKSLQARQAYEVALANTTHVNDGNATASQGGDAKALKMYHKYLLYEHKHGDPSRVISLFQRLVERFPCYDMCWDVFGRFVEIQLKNIPFAKEVYWRSVRNCPWRAHLWIRAVVNAGGCNNNNDEDNDARTGNSSTFNAPSQAELVKAALENGFLLQSASAQEVVSLVLARANTLRRNLEEFLTGNLDEAAEPEDNERMMTAAQSLRSFFAFAFQKVSELYPLASSHEDSSLRFAKYWARCETKLLGDHEEATRVWEGMVDQHRHSWSFWQNWAEFECQYGTTERAREIYDRAYRECTDVKYSWLSFEEENGSAADSHSAYCKTTKVSFDFQIHSLGQSTGGETKRTQVASNHEKKKQPTQERKEKQAGASAEKTEKKRQREKKEDKQSAKRQKSVATEQKAEKAPLESGGKAVDPPPPPTRIFDDQCTLFVRNLPFNLDKAGLTELLGGDLLVKECRIVCDRNTGKSKGFAYVDFKCKEDLWQALKKDGTEVFGKKLSIARSKPPKKPDFSSRGRKLPQPSRKSNVDLSSDAKPQASALVPRHLVKRKQQEKAKPKSNEEFRKLLLNKNKG
jgi:hypothetical protein